MKTRITSKRISVKLFKIQGSKVKSIFTVELKINKRQLLNKTNSSVDNI